MQSETVVDILPIPVILVGAFHVLSGRDSDTGALVRHQLDERQEHERLKVQALVGRVLSIAVAVAYIAASAARTALWPWAILLGLMAISFIGGRLIYGEHMTDTAATRPPEPNPAGQSVPKSPIADVRWAGWASRV